MLKLTDYMNDGAHAPAQAVMAICKYLLGDGIEQLWDDDLKRYSAEVKIGRWENGREQGYVLSLLLDRNLPIPQLNIAFFEHRNSDSIHAIAFKTMPTFDSPTLADIPEGKYKDKWDTDFDVPYDGQYQIACWIHDQFLEFVKKNTA